ncbi:MAG: Signal peptidase I [Parcubacteria group bacterium GW2011_GWF2_42_7]|nr:MAG: Signal peptidase I [Parcubacteria group bacterium GW2011_GWA2_40_37]KKS12176.1 MAG: Signal peptidase I [Parcubacteria group bacterium GW2011_GWB1_41_5]KKS71827.1 MAG: Signal peptidase I [Parcubacteria group bacterium GW2011_GWF2_42_7]
MSRTFYAIFIDMEPTKIEEPTKGQSFWELLRFTIIAILIVVPIRLLVAEPFVVLGSSMVPIFDNANYLIVDKISYKLGNPKRYDVVVFKHQTGNSLEPTYVYYIKRIIGLPNETVDVESSQNKVTITNNEHPDGFELDQPFVKNIGGIDAHVALASDEYFVMGDNRSSSSDSRSWGPVKKEFITGKAFLRLLPLKKIGVSPGQYQKSDKQSQ